MTNQNLGLSNMNGIAEEDDQTCALSDMNCLETTEEKKRSIENMNALAEDDDTTCALTDMNCLDD